MIVLQWQVIKEVPHQHQQVQIQAPRQDYKRQCKEEGLPNPVPALLASWQDQQVLNYVPHLHQQLPSQVPSPSTGLHWQSYLSLLTATDCWHIQSMRVARKIKNWFAVHFKKTNTAGGGYQLILSWQFLVTRRPITEESCLSLLTLASGHFNHQHAMFLAEGAKYPLVDCLMYMHTTHTYAYLGKYRWGHQ